jgi:two-component SAPR family response regulator
VALLEIKPDFCDLLLVDINMPLMNGFELREKILELDVNVRVCFMFAGKINHEAIREVHSTKSIGCYIKNRLQLRTPLID